MGHLEPEERITQILKYRLGEVHGCRHICDRWGRGVYWQWICWVPEPNRKAKPVSGSYNFGSAKFFVSVDREERVFQSGMQIERAPLKPDPDGWQVKLEKDWDWHVLLRALAAKKLPALLKRLLIEGFRIRGGPFSSLTEYDRKTFKPAALRRRLAGFARNEWGGFQLFWPMTEEEVSATPGNDLIDAVMAVLSEVTPAMNLCMYAPCLTSE